MVSCSRVYNPHRERFSNKQYRYDKIISMRIVTTKTRIYLLRLSVLTSEMSQLSTIVTSYLGLIFLANTNFFPSFWCYSPFQVRVLHSPCALSAFFHLSLNVLHGLVLETKALKVSAALRHSFSSSKWHTMSLNVFIFSLCIILIRICSHQLGREQIKIWTCYLSVKLLAPDFNLHIMFDITLGCYFIVCLVHFQ